MVGMRRNGRARQESDQGHAGAAAGTGVDPVAGGEVGGLGMSLHFSAPSRVGLNGLLYHNLIGFLEGRNRFQRCEILKIPRPAVNVARRPEWRNAMKSAYGRQTRTRLGAGLRRARQPD
jgi:hypothetical protein